MQDWYINQEVEPDAYNEKSALSLWLDEVESDDGKPWKCCAPLDQVDTWCDHSFPRLDRATTHVRNHLGHKPYPCGGPPNCKEGWYVRKPLVFCCAEILLSLPALNAFHLPNIAVHTGGDPSIAPAYGGKRGILKFLEERSCFIWL
jgi:hypothetical protein